MDCQWTVSLSGRCNSVDGVSVDCVTQWMVSEWTVSLSGLCHSVDCVTQWTVVPRQCWLQGRKGLGSRMLLLLLFVFDVMHVGENTGVVQNSETASILTQDLKGARG